MKDQLLIKEMITEKWKKARDKFAYMIWIDYKEEYNFIANIWTYKVFELFGISGNIKRSIMPLKSVLKSSYQHLVMLKDHSTSR